MKQVFIPFALALASAVGVSLTGISRGCAGKSGGVWNGGSLTIRQRIRRNGRTARVRRARAPVTVYWNHLPAPHPNE